MDLLRHVGRGTADLVRRRRAGQPGAGAERLAQRARTPRRTSRPRSTRCGTPGRARRSSSTPTCSDYIAGINAYIDAVRWPTATSPASTCSPATWTRSPTRASPEPFTHDRPGRHRRRRRRALRRRRRRRDAVRAGPLLAAQAKYGVDRGRPGLGGVPRRRTTPRPCSPSTTDRASRTAQPPGDAAGRGAARRRHGRPPSRWSTTATGAAADRAVASDRHDSEARSAA